MFEELTVFDDLEARDAALNMAIDEALLEMAARPTLRFYRWSRPALSFGYFGRYAEVADEAIDREIVRRWTGGGIVPHGEDLTYSVIIPAKDSNFANSSPEIYAGIHGAISRALTVNEVIASLADSAGPKISELCFANAVRADVISAGRKVAGAAHRRAKRGLLHQGSIQLSTLTPEFRSDLAQCLSEQIQPGTLSAEVLRRAHAIAEAKYGTREWLTRR